MINWIALVLIPFFLSLSNSAFAGGIFAETLDISVGMSHVCAITSLGVKCFGNAEGVTLKTPSIGLKPHLIHAGNRFSCMIVDEGVKCWGEIPNVSKTEILLGKQIVSKPKLLSVGYDHACAVSQNNKITCLGKNDFGESTPPKNLNNITEISLGMNNSCAIANGNIVCWGMNIDGNTDVPVGLKNPRNLTSGWWHHCVQTDEGIKCWGYPYRNYVAPDDLSIAEFSSGGFYNCGIVVEGVKCWDETGKTQLVEDSIGAFKLSVGATNACAVTLDKGVICWHLESVNKKFKLLKSFVPSGGVEKIDLVSSGHASTCVFGDSNNIKCWGFNPLGALDVPYNIPGSVSQISVGAHKSCVIADSILNCWGDSDSDYKTPADLGKVSFVSSGGNQICAGTSEKLKCWGDDIRGALQIPKDLVNISQISSGFSHVCAVANDETTCWGGIGLIKNVNPPQKMLKPRSICAGGTFSCGISEGGSVKCWGDKIQFVGKTTLLDKTRNEVLNIPLEIQNANVAEVSCGLSHACAIYNKKVRCWGDGEFLPSRLTVPSISNPRNLTAGWNHTCAIGDKGLSCWGTMLNMNMPNYSLEK